MWENDMWNMHEGSRQITGHTHTRMHALGIHLKNQNTHRNAELFSTDGNWFGTVNSSKDQFRTKLLHVRLKYN